MLAELSNPAFVEKLKKINVFEKLVENIVKLFLSAKEMFGLKRSNAYEKLKEQVIEIIQNYNPNFTKEYEEKNFKRNISLANNENNQANNPSFIYHTDKSKGIAELRADLKGALTPLVKQNIHNKETKLQGIITNEEIKKISSKKAVDKSLDNGFTRDEHFKVSQNLKTLFENAHLTQTHRDYKERPNIEAVHRFNTSLNINNKEAVAKITLFEKKVGKNRIYTLELEGLTKPDSLSTSVNSTESAVKAQSLQKPHDTAPATIAKTDEGIITQIQERFKFDTTKAKDLYLWQKDSSPLTKDKEGIPKVFYHATSADKKFSVFDKDKIHSGYGFWFGENPRDKAVVEAKTGKAPIYKVFLKIKKPFVLEDLNKDNIKDFEKVFNMDLTERVKLKEVIEKLENMVKKELKVEDVFYATPYAWEIKNNGKWQIYMGQDFLKLITPKIKKEIEQHTINLPHTHRGYTQLHLPRAYNGHKQQVDHVLKTLKELGYDGIDNYGEVVVFNSSQIKAVDNKGLNGEYFNAQSPNIYHSNPHLGSGLVGGSIAGFENDEEGNLTFNPQNFLLGLAAGSIGSKAVAQGFKIIKDNPKFRDNLQNELANTLSKGWESAVRQYPVLQSLEPKYIVKNEKGRAIQAKSIMKEIEEREAKGLYNVTYNGKKSTRVFKDLRAVEEAILLKGF